MERVQRKPWTEMSQDPLSHFMTASAMNKIIRGLPGINRDLTSLLKLIRHYLGLCLNATQMSSLNPKFLAPRVLFIIHRVSSQSSQETPEKHSFLRSNFSGSWKHLRQGHEEESGFPDHLLVVLAKALSALKFSLCTGWQPWPLEITSVLLQSTDSSTVSQNSLTMGTSSCKTPTWFWNYLVHGIFNILFQNCLSQWGEGEWKQRTQRKRCEIIFR